MVMCLGISYWYWIWVLGLGRYVNWLWVCGGWVDELWVCGGCECVTDELLESEWCTGVVSLCFHGCEYLDSHFFFGSLGKGADRNHLMFRAEIPQLHSEQLIYCLSSVILVC